jgi:hypothetical protein
VHALGLTLKEIQALVRANCAGSGGLVDGLLQEHLPRALARVDAQISALQARRQHILAFQAASAGAPIRPAAAALLQLLAASSHQGAEHAPA